MACWGGKVCFDVRSRDGEGFLRLKIDLGTFGDCGGQRLFRTYAATPKHFGSRSAQGVVRSARRRESRFQRIVRMEKIGKRRKKSCEGTGGNRGMIIEGTRNRQLSVHEPNVTTE